MFVFVFTRIIDIFTAYFSGNFIAYKGFFPYKEIIDSYGLPGFISAFANFDGAQYLIIASQHYYTYNQAYFPLYPLLIRYLAFIAGGNHLVAGLLISNISFLGGLWFLGKFLKEAGFEKKDTVWISAFLVVFPTAFFFGALYTEGLFLFLLAGSLYFFKKEKPLYSGIFGFLAGLTRVIGVFISIYFLIVFILEAKRAGTLKFSKLIKTSKLRILNIISPVLGLGVYSFYLYHTTGDGLFFLTSQPAFGANRSSSIVLLPQVIFRYLKIFATSDFNFQFLIAVLELAVFTVVFGLLILWILISAKKGLRKVKPELLALWVFSLVNITLPTLTGTLSSAPRYALFSLSFFLILGSFKNLYIKSGIAVLFLALHIVLLGFFIQGYFVS